jgi:hypothetical protein
MKELSTIKEIKEWLGHFNDEGVDLTLTEIDQVDRDWLRFSVNLYSTPVTVIIGIRKDCIQCSVGFADFFVSSEKRSQVCELINRINYAGMLSFMAMNMDDGHIVCSAYLPFDDHRCKASDLRMVLLQTLTTAAVGDRMVKQVSQGHKTPKVAFEEIQRETYQTR